MNASGLALVVWSPTGPPGGLWAKTRVPSARWSSPQRISSFGTALYYLPLALNARGAAVVSWVASKPNTETAPLTVAVRSVDGRFGRPQTIGGDAYWGFVVALARSGEATLMWANDSCCLFAMSRRPGAHSFTSEQVLERGTYQSVPGALAMDARGNTLALWTQVQAQTGEFYMHAAQRPAGASFEGGRDLADIGPDSYKHSACSGAPSLAVTPSGRLAFAVWLTRSHPNGGCTAVEAARFMR